MNIRETLAEKPRLAAAIVGVLVIAGIVVAARQLTGSSSSVAAQSTKAFFTIDDGKTWFVDDESKIPPFDKDGKQAVRAYVFRAANGTTFVNHLERFTAQAKQLMEEAQRPADPKSPPPPGRAGQIQSALIAGREVKRPGDAKWISSANLREAAEITTVSPRNGGGETVPLEP